MVLKMTKEKANWTFMVYLAGDNSLSNAGGKDIEEMRSVGSAEGVHVVAQFDQRNHGCRRYCLQRNGCNEFVDDLGKADSGSPQVLNDFVDWAMSNYPSNRYALILWSHGSGWEPDEVERLAASTNILNFETEATTAIFPSFYRNIFFSSTMRKLLDNSSLTKAICKDDGSGHSLDTIELGNVLFKVASKIGRPLDLLGMDACLMSNFETAYQVAPYVQYMVASEESEPSDGWPYDAILGKLTRNPQMLPQELAFEMVSAYAEFYKNKVYKTKSLTQTALNLSKVAETAEKLDALANALVAHMPEADKELIMAQTKSASFYFDKLWDISHLLEELQKTTSDQSVIKASKDVRTCLESGPESFIIAESNLGLKVQKCCGVSIYLPFKGLSRYYSELEFAKCNHWGKILVSRNVDR